MEDIAEFLGTCPVFSGVPPDQLGQMAQLFRTASYPAGTLILQQGGQSSAVYVVRSGRMAVRVDRGGARETIAVLQSRDIFGELSFLTGRACVADVEVTVDAEVVFLTHDAMPKIVAQKEAVLQGLLAAVAHRLQTTVLRESVTREMPVVLVEGSPGWGAQAVFAHDLALLLSRESGHRTLLVEIGADGTGRDRGFDDIGELTTKCEIAADADDCSLRSSLAKLLTENHEFDNVVLSVGGPEAGKLAAQAAEFANFKGYLAGPDETVPEAAQTAKGFLVQDASGPTLQYLAGNRQLIYDAAEAEREFHAGETRSPRFLRTVSSIARYLCGTQVGLALGGGAAWGWAHIGVLAVIEDAGIPIDAISGCSMGSVVAALRSSGRSVEELLDIAEYWRTRTLRFVEWRFWRMCLLNEGAVRTAFERYFGSRRVNQMDIPFWANAVDIERGRERAIRDGTVVDCIRGSIALPGLLPPFRRPPDLLVDATFMDPVPARLARDMGCNFVIAVNAMAEPGSTPLSDHYPFNAFHVMNRCMYMMGHEIGQARAEEAADVVFTPQMDGISLLQFKRSPEIIARGRLAAERHISAIRESYQRLRQRATQAKVARPAGIPDGTVPDNIRR